MKKNQTILASATVLMAAGSVFATTLVARVDYRPNFANSNATSGEFCDEPIPITCNDIGNIRCIHAETYSTPMGPITKSVIISKRIDEGPCEAVMRQD